MAVYGSFMNRKNARIFLNELPSLEAQGLIDHDTSTKLRHHCEGIVAEGGTTSVFTIISSLAAILIGSGIILLIAHNWDHFPRGLKLFIAFLPLLISQGLLFYSLAKKRSNAWKEFSSLLITLSIAAAISIVSQVYHIQGSLEGFLLTWLLPVIPLALYTRSFGTSLLYSFLVLFWFFTALDGKGPLFHYWLFLSVLPAVWFLGRKTFTENHGALFSSIISLLAVTGIITTSGKISEDILLLTVPITSAALTGVYEYRGNITGRLTRVMGYLLGIGLIYLLSFQFPWENAHGWDEIAKDFSEAGVDLFHLFIPLLLIVAVVYFIYNRRKDLREAATLIMILPFIMLPFFIVRASTEMVFLPQFFFNIYLLGMGAVVIRSGLRDQNFSRINGGMLLLLLVIMTRFFDSALGFAAKGIIFIILGILFLLVNLYLRRRLEASR